MLQNVLSIYRFGSIDSMFPVSNKLLKQVVSKYRYYSVRLVTWVDTSQVHLLRAVTLTFMFLIKLLVLPHRLAFDLNIFTQTNSTEFL